MTEHEHCSTCGRSTAACPECAQPWPDGTPGYLDPDGWHNGPRPTMHRPAELVRAERRAETAQRAYDEARSAWEAVASEHHTVRHRSRTEATMFIDADGALREVGAADPAEIARLAAAETSAKDVMDAAGEELVQARMAHRRATSAARAAG